MTITWRRKIAYGVLTLLLISAVGFGALLATDVYVHRRVQNLGGVNVWGYRGPAIGRKQPNEMRIVVVGGSTVFGYGVPYNEAFPFYLERLLNANAGPARSYLVVNLGGLSQGAHAFRFDLADYAYLHYDVAILYEGYNDLSLRGVPAAVPPRDRPNDLLWRRQSPLFRVAGYFPVLPLVLREKAMQLMAGGDLDAAYRGHVTFRPGLAVRATAASLESAAKIADTLGFELGPFSGGVPPLGGGATTQPDLEIWRHYTTSVLNAVSFARGRGVKVIVVTQPYASDAHVEQQQTLAAALAAKYGSDPGLRHVNLGTVVDLRDRTIAYDGLHLVAQGNQRIARGLAQPVPNIVKQ